MLRPAYNPASVHRGQEMSRSTNPEAVQRYEINRVSREVGKGISDPPLQESIGVTKSDLWWFPPTRGHLGANNGTRSKLKYATNDRWI